MPRIAKAHRARVTGAAGIGSGDQAQRQSQYDGDGQPGGGQFERRGKALGDQPRDRLDAVKSNRPNRRAQGRR